MKTSIFRCMLATLLVAVPLASAASASWDGDFKHHDWKKDSWKKEDCKKKPCPIVKPVCPVFDGTNGAVVNFNQQTGEGKTLEVAIEEANASDATPCNPFVIEFDLPAGVTTIFLDEDLPIITKPVCMNGFTNSGASEFCRTIVVSICGSSAAPNTATNGFVFAPTACGSTIKGFNIFGFSTGSGIIMRASCSLISGNNIGDTSDELPACFPNGGVSKQNNIGITVEIGKNITIGGLCPHEKNIISGNNDQGVSIKSDHVTVVGNYIGTDETGIFARPNAEGVLVEGNNNVIGCDEKWGGNLISGNSDKNVEIVGNCNKVVNDIIGLDKCGTRALGDASTGVEITGFYNKLFKSVISARFINVNIAGSYNKVICNRIGTDICGKKAFISLAGVSLGGELESGLKTTSNCIENNLITVSGGTGISIFNASATVIRKNRIGSDCKEKCLLGQSIGIDIQSTACFSSQAFSTTCTLSPRPPREHHCDTKRFPPQPTGTCERPCGDCKLESGCCPTVAKANESVDTCIEDNVILGNICAGIRLSTSTRFTTIKRNSIGINKKCCVVPNGYGILLENGAQNNHITCNLIVGNKFDGIAVEGVVPPPCVVFFAQTVNNALTKNCIFGNCGSGIRLVAGGNNCLGAPLITSATACDGELEVVIDTASLPKAPFRIELYGNVNARKCVSEGQVLLCCKTIKEEFDTAQLILKTKLPCPELKFVTATVTELTTCFDKGNTSEYSCPVRIDNCVQA